MEASDYISIIALVIATLSAGFTFFQINLARKSNMMPIIIDMLTEFRSSEFKAHQRYIYNSLKSRANTGFRDLEDAEKEHVFPVSFFFNHLGTLVMEKMINKKFILKFMAKSLLDTWYKLSPFIYSERDKYWKIDNYSYQEGFEFLAVLSKNYLDKLESEKPKKRFQLKPLE